MPSTAVAESELKVSVEKIMKLPLSAETVGVETVTAQVETVATAAALD
jgi:hypothetical protein